MEEWGCTLPLPNERDWQGGQVDTEFVWCIRTEYLKTNNIVNFCNVLSGVGNKRFCRGAYVWARTVARGRCASFAAQGDYVASRLTVFASLHQRERVGSGACPCCCPSFRTADGGVFLIGQSFDFLMLASICCHLVRVCLSATSAYQSFVSKMVYGLL